MDFERILSSLAGIESSTATPLQFQQRITKELGTRGCQVDGPKPDAKRSQPFLTARCPDGKRVAVLTGFHSKRHSVAAIDQTTARFVLGLSRLETKVIDHSVDLGYAVLLTDDDRYWRDAGLIDGDLHLTNGRTLGPGSYTWSDTAGQGSKPQNTETVAIRSTYTIDWRTFNPGGRAAFRYLLLTCGIESERPESLAAPAELSDLLAAVARCGTGESERHRTLKQFVALHPEVLNLPPSAAPGRTEVLVASGDILDVHFDLQDEAVCAEVKSSISDEADILRGLFQCVKYKAVLEAQQVVSRRSKKVRTVLVLESKLPSRLAFVRDSLGIEVREEVRPHSG